MKSTGFMSEIADRTWIKQLRDQLGNVVPGSYQPPKPVTPGLTYGRHAGPPKFDARHASVLLLCYQDSDAQWKIPLVVRAQSGDVHSGQIAFPGGRLEPDETPQQAALRECAEETGAIIKPEMVLGQMDASFVYASRHWVHVFVAVCNEEPAWIPCEREVDCLFHMPVAAVFEVHRFSSFLMDRKKMRFSAPSLEWESHQIWGATRHILSDFAEILANSE
ncbi:MAG: NUDIX hydrolase [Pirellulales bacterium]